MKPHVEEALRTLRLADGDIAAFRVLSRAPEVPLAPTGFHAQQAVEKCLKAVLFQHGIEFPPVHDLVRLAGILREHGISVPCPDDDLRRLNPFAVILRYDVEPRTDITVAEAETITATARRWAGTLVG